jgi:TfoX/Sxy family transcriptional regulator of competence genes
MAYDEQLAERIRGVLGDDPGIGERKMFGGVAFLLDGNMFVGVTNDDLMVRVGPDAWTESLAQPHAREMDFTGRSMKGYVFVAAEGTAEDDDLAAWVDRALAFVGSLPPK